MAATRTASLALCALIALTLVSHAVSRADPAGAAVSVTAYPCDGPVAILFPHGADCERDRCGSLCVEQFMWKYPGIKAVVGDCPKDHVRECVCSFLC